MKGESGMFKDWQLAMMEDYGLMDTNTGLINRVARTLAQSPNDTIETAEFRSACSSCGVDPDSSGFVDPNPCRFSRADLG